MAPLTQALKVEYASDGVYRGNVDKDWCIGTVPNGGFSLGLLLEACIQYQSTTKHPDPIHVNAHYLKSVNVAPFEVRVRTLKAGRGFSNIVAEMVQQDSTRITAHLIFGVLTPLPNEPGPKLTLKPPSPYARRHPLHGHPSVGKIEKLRSTWGFSTMTKWIRDPVYIEMNKPDHPSRTNSSTVGGGGVEWGAWFHLEGKDERITTPALCFCADIFQNTPILVGKEDRKGLGASWFPTMTLSIEFKFAIPKPSSDHAARTVGLYSTGKFINDPQGRHDVYVEVWTAPCEIGEGKEEEGWRDKQVCLATSSQMALAIPMEVNTRRGAKM